MKTVLIIGHYGVINWGDEAILSGLLLEIKNKGESIPKPLHQMIPIVVSANPDFTKKEHHVSSISPPPFGIRSFFTFQWFSFFSTLKKTNAVIIGGGGLFQPNPSRAFWIWAYYLLLALIFQKPVFILGNSFEIPKKNSVIVAILKKLFTKVQYFSVRDEESVKIGIDFWKIPQEKIQLKKDFAYYNTTENFCTQNTEKYTAIMMREGDITENQEKIIIDTLKKNFPTSKIKVIVMQKNQANDEKIAIRQGLSIVFPGSLSELFSLISSAKQVVSSRLHGSILADLFNKKRCIIAPRAKIVNLFGKSNCVKPEEISEENIMAFLTKTEEA